MVDFLIGLAAFLAILVVGAAIDEIAKNGRAGGNRKRHPHEKIDAVVARQRSQAWRNRSAK